MSGPVGDPGSWSNDQWMRWYDEVLEHDPVWERATGRSTRGTPSLSDEELNAALQGINLGAGGPTARFAFSELSDDFKRRVFDWYADRHDDHHWDDTLPEDESIIDELEPAAPIGVAGRGAPPDPEVDSAPAVAAGADPDPDVVTVDDWATDPDDLGVNITLPNDNVAHVTSEPDRDPTVHITDAGGAPVDPNAAEPFRTEPPTVGGPAVEPGDVEMRGCLPSPKKVAAFAAAVVLVGAGAFAVRGGDDGEPGDDVVAVADDPEFAELDDGIDPIESDEGEGDEAVVEECVFTEDHDMTLSTPAVVDGAMDSNTWLRTFLAAGDYPTPAFTISGTPPPGTTELAIVITDVTKDATEVESDPNAAEFWRYIPLWVGTGIDPAITEIGAANALTPPLGVTPQDETNGGAELSDGSLSRSAFISVDGTGTMLFTLLAMCDPPADYWDTARNGWLAGRIATYSFTAYVPPLG